LYEFKEACRAAVRPSISKAKRVFFENHGDEEGKVRCVVTRVNLPTLRPTKSHS
jgi:hypothetical protein